MAVAIRVNFEDLEPLTGECDEAFKSKSSRDYQYMAKGTYPVSDKKSLKTRINNAILACSRIKILINKVLEYIEEAANGDQNNKPQQSA